MRCKKTALRTNPNPVTTGQVKPDSYNREPIKSHDCLVTQSDPCATR